MDIDAYFDRIGMKRRPPATLAGLTALHHAHLLAIPYDGLDIQLGRPVTIERPAIFDKIVTRRRGGWCYEMNGLFGWALGELGFAVTRATGAVTVSDNRDANIGNHLVLRVDLDEGAYLADVGLSHGPRDPFPITAGDFASDGFAYKVEQLDGRWWRFHNHSLANPPAFDFDISPADESVLATRCEELQRESWSPFVQNLICTRFTDDAVLVLLGRTLTTIKASGKTEHLIASADELVSVLSTRFGLDVPEAAALWPKVCKRHEAILAQRAAAAAS
ncbi:MAG TPA: arylamine N-acetyltransferase [Caulobacteraceae bacterium]|jgi:N-hydroxyarylamine O-acetyltransferase